MTKKKPKKPAKIVGLISWYDESAAWLTTAVTGFARVCDHIVACDGAYALLPGARPCSHPRQAEAIMGAAEAAGVGCTIHRPSELFFGNEIEKRQFCLGLAGALDPMWIVVFDADVHVFKCEPEIVRWELENTTLPAATYTVLEGVDMLADPDLAEMVKREEYDQEWTVRTKDIYRWHPSLLYGPQHWMISREIDGKRKWIRHSSSDCEPALNLDASLVAYHRTQDRAYVRKQTQEGYYKMRELHGIEPTSNKVPEPLPPDTSGAIA